MEKIHRTPKWHDGYSFRLSIGCDTEAMSIIANNSRRTTAKQHGRPVGQRIIQSFVFKMQ